ncbi:MAG: tryptophan synthase subunit alpha [Spirochaetota bacterium]|nr:tryptophan synthase subunit alpha [Spirochaetota bacterium]
MSNSITNKSLMTHIVLGYPSLEHGKELISAMADAGVDYIELQIPFTDPIADGKTILNANQAALKNNVSVADCFNFAKEMTSSYKTIDFLFMTYYNIVFNTKIEKFIKDSSKAGMYGLIVPDITPEEDREDFFLTCKKYSQHPVYVFSPTTSEKRLRNIKKVASGFTYCTSRVGTTGAGKKPHEHLKNYIIDARKIIDLPIAVGFGIDSASSAKRISEFADIIVIGSKILNIMDESGNRFVNDVYKFLYNIKKSIS